MRFIIQTWLSIHSMKKYFYLFVSVAIILLVNCTNEEKDIDTTEDFTPILYSDLQVTQASAQRVGTAEKGLQYLLYGDSLTSGIPLAIKAFLPPDDDLGRLGINKGLNFRYTAHKAYNGVEVMSPSCLTCHAEKLNGKVIIGLGTNTADYTADQAGLASTLSTAIQTLYGANSKEAKAYEQLGKSTKAMTSFLNTKVRGVNPADKVFATLSAHRVPSSLTWNDTPAQAIPQDVVPTDVPAWWLLKKKNTLYYNGLGVGDHARLSSASGLLNMRDSTDARVLDKHMIDVIAYIKTIAPPKYPQAINSAIASDGQKIYTKHCSTCHGTPDKYPNHLVPLKTIGTDPLLAHTYTLYPAYHTWYNVSWYNKGNGSAKLVPTQGYVAPPLDGIWASAPYFHNASVPTLQDALLSTSRPKLWKRSFTNEDYNYEKLGWNYSTPNTKIDIETYDTTIPGYGNYGHNFGDILSTSQRAALLEYLKTL
jgi:cytochrome c5